MHKLKCFCWDSGADPLTSAVCLGKAVCHSNASMMSFQVFVDSQDCGLANLRERILSVPVFNALNFVSVTKNLQHTTEKKTRCRPAKYISLVQAQTNSFALRRSAATSVSTGRTPCSKRKRCSGTDSVHFRCATLVKQLRSVKKLPELLMQLVR